MKPAAFAYHRVHTLAETLEALAEHGEDGRILAGGQSLLPLMNFRLAQPEQVVDINPVQELAYVRRDGGHVRIGALARQSVVERSEVVCADVPLLAEGLRWVAHETIRHRGTVCGSLAHADPAAELPAVALALDAELTLASAAGERVVAAADFFQGPFMTAIRTGELLREVAFPVAMPGTGYAFAEFARRHGDFAIAGAAVWVRLEGGRVADSRVVLCSVAGTPYRAVAAEARLAGLEPDAQVVAAAAAGAVEGVVPTGDIHGSSAYRVRVAGAMVRRALATAVGRARGVS